MQIRLWLIAAAFVGTASCTSLPDTSGYTEATLQLRQSAAAAGGALRTELARTGAQVPAGPQREAMQTATGEFDAAWGDTIESLAAMGRYAQAVQDLTAAGNQGGESARQVSQSVLSLAGAVGLVPGAAIAGVATETLALLNSAVANVRASRSLGRSLAAADPIIKDIGAHVVTQVGTARLLFGALISQQRGALDFGYSDVRDVAAALREAEAGAVARALDPGSAGDQVQPYLTRLRDARAVLAPRITAYDGALADLAARERVGLELFDATEAALQSWADSHSRMVTAIRERRPVSFESLLSAGQEIRSLVQRWRDL